MVASNALPIVSIIEKSSSTSRSDTGSTFFKNSGRLYCSHFSHTGQNSLRCRFLPRMFSVMFTARMPGSLRARSSSSTASFTSCIGSVMVPMKRLGCLTCSAELPSLIARASLAPNAGFAQSTCGFVWVHTERSTSRSSAIFRIMSTSVMFWRRNDARPSPE